VISAPSMAIVMDSGRAAGASASASAGGSAGPVQQRVAAAGGNAGVAAEAVAGGSAHDGSAAAWKDIVVSYVCAGANILLPAPAAASGWRDCGNCCLLHET
jgi:hypothetical protein